MLATKKPTKRSSACKCVVASAVLLTLLVTSFAVFLHIHVTTPPLSNVFLSQKFFPPGQQLKLKQRRVVTATKSSPSTLCDGYGVLRDFYFTKMGGVQCAQLAWRSAAEFEEGDRYIAYLETVYKAFDTIAHADEYFVKFWGRHLYDPLPSYLYVNETETAPAAGDAHRAFRWDVGNVVPGMPVPLQAASTPRHVVYIFREGRFFVRIVMQAFSNARDQRLSVETAGRLAGVVTDLIRSNRLPEWQERFRNIQSSCQDGVAKLFRPVSKAFRKRFALARKWFKGKMTSIFESLSHKDFRWTFLVVQDVRLLLIALVVLLHNRFNAFLKPYEEMMKARLFC